MDILEELRLWAARFPKGEGFPTAATRDTITRAADRIEALEAAIRRHMNMRGDDRCHLDDGELYAVLPEGDTRPPRETAVTLENCQRYIECRQQGREYVSPQTRIEELEAEVVKWRGLCQRVLNAHAGQDGLFAVVDAIQEAMKEQS